MFPMAALGLVVYKLVIERAAAHRPGLTIVATFALALITEASSRWSWGPNPKTTTPGYFNQAIHIGSLVVPRGQLYACLLGDRDHRRRCGRTVKRTWLGHAITAASENPEGARLVGIEPARVGAWIFAIATGDRPRSAVPH